MNTNKKIIENLNHYRDFVHIDDIASAINLCGKLEQGVFNIDRKKPRIEI